MANKLTLLKCPQCGSSHVEPVSDDRFQCKSCKSFFMYDSNRIYNITNNTYHNADPFVSSSAQKKAMMAISIFSIVFVGGLALFYLITGNSSHRSYTEPTPAKKEKQEIKTTTTVLTDSGPQVWKLVNVKTDMDHNRFMFIREDAVTRKEVMRDTLSGELEWGAMWESPYWDADLYSYGPYCFLIYAKKSRVKAFYTANGQVAWDEKTFPQKFPEFKSTIVEITEGSGRYRQFSIRAGNGLTYHYFPENDTVISHQSYDNVNYQYKYAYALKDTTYFSFADQQTEDGKYASLYRIRITNSSKDTRNGYYFSDDFAGRLSIDRERAEARVLDYAQITPQIHYFHARRIYQDGKRVVVSYRADANDKGPVLISLIQADGTVTFTAGGQDTEPLRDILGYYNEAICYRERLFFYKQGDDVEIGILNLKTGKLDLHYKQDRE